MAPEADIRWTDTETERLLGVMEDQIDILHTPLPWAKKAKELEFPNDKHITIARIKQKLTNIKRTYVKVRTDYQDRTGFGVTEEDCRTDVAGKLPREEKTTIDIFVLR